MNGAAMHREVFVLIFRAVPGDAITLDSEIISNVDHVDRVAVREHERRHRVVSNVQLCESCRVVILFAWSFTCKDRAELACTPHSLEESDGALLSGVMRHQSDKAVRL